MKNLSQRFLFLVICFLFSSLFSACVTREDIRGLQTDLYGIQKDLQANLGNVKDQTDTVQTSQADLLNNIQGLSTNLAALQVELEDNRNRMKQLSLRLDDLEASLKARMDAQIELLSGSKFVETPLPSTVFNLANADFSRGHFSEAIKGFQNYLKLYPKGEQSSEAKIKVGDSFVKLKEFDSAVESYSDLLESSPKDPLGSQALLKKGQAYELSGNLTAAIKTYDALIKTYPSKSETRAAQDRLNDLKSNSSK